MEEKNLKFVKLPNSIYCDLYIANEELTFLVLAYRNFMQYKNLSICSLKLIAEDYMLYDTKNNRDILPTIKSCIESLIEKEYILGIYDLYYNEISIEDINDKNKMFYLELKELPADDFFMVYDNNLNNIFKSIKGSKINKWSLIRYYIAICRVINTENRFGYLTQSKIKGLINHGKTISSYNKILQDELNLIQYNNSYWSADKHYTTTFFGEYGDSNFEELVKAQASENKLIFTDKTESNLKRSIKQKENNKNKKNDKDRIKELELMVKQYEMMNGGVQ